MARVQAPQDVKAALYPEVRAGGFTRVDGTIEFYQRVRSLLTPDMMVLDFGAGRGKFVEDPVRARRDLQHLRGSVRRVVGVDVDGVVMTNPALDEAHVIESGSPLPIASTSIDLVVSDWTFEHVSNPSWVAGELDRVLKAGGWICARTPNRWGYIALGARLVPNTWQVSVLRWLQPGKARADTFPTCYRMNTFRDLARLFPLQRYGNASYTMDSEPAYFGNSLLASRLAKAAFRFVPQGLASVLYVFLRKCEGATLDRIPPSPSQDKVL